MDKILVIGCSGQIGSELTLELRKLYGNANVIATDIRPAPVDVLESGPFETLDVLDVSKLQLILEHEKVTQVYHLAAILSGNAEKRPLPSWDTNMRSLMNILELSKELKIQKVFWPS